MERERVDYKFIYNNPFLSIATCYHWEKVFLIGKMASWKGSQHTFRHAPVATERRNGPYLRLMTGGHRVESSRERSVVSHLFLVQMTHAIGNGEIVSRVAEHKPAQKLQTNGKEGGGG